MGTEFYTAMISPEKMLPCPFCGGEGAYQTDTEEDDFSEEWIGCLECGATTALEVWNRRAPSPELLTLRAERDEARDSDDEMLKISALIARLQGTLDQFGDTCVYIRRGGLSWGAVALNRRSDDEKNGVFDLQATHDRAMEERLGQVQRLIEDKNEWRDKALAAEAQLARQGEALKPALDRLELFLNTYGDWPQFATQADIDDWRSTLSPEEPSNDTP